jgi:uncharacterized protein (DUF1499 family)
MVVIALVVVSLGCGGRMPEGIGASHGMLSACPDKPNCVSSFAADAEHRIAAIRLADAPAATWQGLQSILAADGSARIVMSSDDYLHVVFTSTIMRYRDDVEFILFADDGQIAVRSASRVGHSDLGVNRERIEDIRRQLADQGLAHALESGS